MLSTAERLFRDEVRDKKRTANGVHSRTGKRGYVGRMKFPSEMLKGKEKREYQKSGKVVVWNMYSNSIEFDMFMELPINEQRVALEKLRENNTNEKIKKMWGLSNKTYYELVDKLGIEKKGNNTIEKTRISLEELKSYLHNLIPIKKFKSLPDEQQYPLIIEYLKSMKPAELAKAWDVSIGYVYGSKSRLKKRIDAGEIELIQLNPENEIKLNIVQSTEGAESNVQNEPEPTEQTSIQLEESETAPTSTIQNSETNHYPKIDNAINEAAPIPNQPTYESSTGPVEAKNETPTRNYGTTLSFDGEYTQAQLIKKLQTMAELLEDDGRFYKLNISFTEIKE